MLPFFLGFNDNILTKMTMATGIEGKGRRRREKEMRLGQGAQDTSPWYVFFLFCSFFFHSIFYYFFTLLILTNTCLGIYYDYEQRQWTPPSSSTPPQCVWSPKMAMSTRWTTMELVVAATAVAGDKWGMFHFHFYFLIILTSI